MMDFAIVVDFLGIIRVFRMFRGLASKTRENGGCYDSFFSPWRREVSSSSEMSMWRETLLARTR